MLVKKITTLILMSSILYSCSKDELLVVDRAPDIKPQPVDSGDFQLNNEMFKVSPSARTIGKEYWENIPYPAELYLSVYQKAPKQTQTHIETEAISWGDFNNDGYMDIFNAGGTNNFEPYTYFTFLIWNKNKKIFEEQNLFNDKSFKIFGGNAHTIIPKYFNNDNYIDLLIMDSGDESHLIPNNLKINEPIRIVLSDGNGGYDLKEIETNENDSFIKVLMNKKWGGDIGDLNGDGIDDLFMACNSVTYIYWGIPQFPYFKKEGRILFVSDINNGVFNGQSNLSTCNECADHVFDGKIVDINNDGKNDIVAFGSDKNGSYYQRIMINKSNNGRFENGDLIKLPLNHPIDRKDIQHLIVDDFNNDGKKDIFYLINEMTGDKYSMGMYIQNSNNTFKLEKSWSDYVTPYFPIKLIYSDFNKDGIKDVSLQESYGNIKEQRSQNRIYNKKVLIRNGNKFDTKDFYELDSHAKSIRDTYF